MGKREEALNSKARVRLIIGQPGVGKTYFGCQLAEHELSDGLVPPNGKILFLTFARNAVARIRQVYLQHTIPAGISEAERKRHHDAFQDRVRVDTFAGFFWKLIAAYGRYLPGGSISRPWFIGSERVGGENVPSGYTGFTFLESEHAASGLLSLPAIRGLITTVYPLIIIDEHQDVNESLHEILALLAGESRLVLLRGPGQCIYRSLRQTDPEIVLNKTKERFAPEVFEIEPLGENRQRCIPEIQALVSRYDHRGQCTWTGDRTLRIFVRRDEKNSYRLDIETCKTVHAVRKKLRQIYPGKKCSIAVLASTNQAVADIYDRLQKGSQAFGVSPVRASLHFDDSILLHYGRIVLELLSDHWIALPRITANPELVAVALAALPKGGGLPKPWILWAKAVCEKVQRQRKPKEGGYLQSLSRNIDVINDSLRAKAEEKPRGTPRSPFTANDTALLSLLRDEILHIIEPHITRHSSVNIQEVRKAFERELQHRIILEKLGIEHGVQVMTIHKSKGREFDGVVLVLEDNQTALWKAESRTPEAEKEDLFRVGISRARDVLALVAYDDAIGEAGLPVQRLLR